MFENANKSFAFVSVLNFNFHYYCILILFLDAFKNQFYKNKYKNKLLIIIIMYLKYLYVFLIINNILTNGLSLKNMINILGSLKKFNLEKTSNIVLRNSNKIYKNNNFIT
jgi:uncharacterized membrane protein